MHGGKIGQASHCGRTDLGAIELAMRWSGTHGTQSKCGLELELNQEAH